MVASGVQERLRAVPAALPRLELAAGMAASLAGLGPLLGARLAGRAAPVAAPGFAVTICHQPQRARTVEPPLSRELRLAEHDRSRSEPSRRVTSGWPGYPRMGQRAEGVPT